jgi:hypothetical protein
MRDWGARIKLLAGGVRTVPCVGVIAVIVVTLGIAAPPAGAQSDTDEVNQVLAVVNAAGGTLRESGDEYRLVLTGIEPRAVWFSDRPARAVGSLTIDELTRAFFAGDDDPNAALEVFEGSGTGDVVVVELSNPRHRRGRSRLVLDARVLTQDELADSALRAHAERATSDVPARFGAAALYIDDATACLFGDGGAGGDGGDGGDGGVDTAGSAGITC